MKTGTHSFRRSRALLWAAAVFAVVAAAVGEPANALTPSITASPKVVLVAPNADFGYTTISFNTGGATHPRIHEVLVGQNKESVFPPPIPRGSQLFGSFKERIYVGEIYRFRLGVFEEGSAAEHIVGEVQVRAERLPSPCQLQCIKDVLPTAFGTHADFLVDTTSPASLLVQVGTDPPGSDGKLSTNVAWAGFSLAMKTKHFVRPTGLASKTHYYWAVIAKDKYGKTAVRNGAFTTKIRLLTIQFKEVHMCTCTEGSSSWLDFFAGKPGDPSYREAHRSGGWERGKTYIPGKSFFIKDAPPEIEILVVGVRDDGNNTCGTAPLWFPATEWGHGGCSAAAGRAEGWLRVTLDALHNPGPEAGEAFTTTSTYVVKYSSKPGAVAFDHVKFNVKVRWHVEYL